MWGRVFDLAGGSGTRRHTYFVVKITVNANARLWQSHSVGIW
jgi:hypothetical protein